VPESKRTPVIGLSNLLSSSEDRTPRSCISWIWRSICALSQVTCSQPRQSNGSEVSISSTTATRPELMTRRASNGSVTTWKKPLPGPPACASTYCWRSLIAWKPRRIVSISLQLSVRLACSSQSTRFSLTPMTMSRMPAFQTRSTQR
jgi:hypothetical protein